MVSKLTRIQRSWNHLKHQFTPDPSFQAGFQSSNLLQVLLHAGEQFVLHLLFAQFQWMFFYGFGFYSSLGSEIIFIWVRSFFSLQIWWIFFSGLGVNLSLGLKYIFLRVQSISFSGFSKYFSPSSVTIFLRLQGKIFSG